MTCALTVEKYSYFIKNTLKDA